MNDVEIRHGDCLRVLPSLESDSVPLIIADPPYGIGYHSNHYKDKNPHSPVANDWNFRPGLFFSECRRLLRDGGALYLFCRWDVTPLWLPYLNGAGLKVKTVIAWVKDNWSAGDLEGCFGNQYEHILFVTKGRHRLRGRRWPNVWSFPRVSHTKMLHPTQKPVELLERAVQASSDAGDTIVDPFAGSGSTGLACLNTGRRAVLIDVDPRMIVIAANRLGVPCPIDRPAESADEAVSSSPLEIPSPAEWGIHPEELLAIHESIRGNLMRSDDDKMPLFDPVA